MVFGDCFCADVECEDIEPQHIHAILRTSLCAAFAAVGKHTEEQLRKEIERQKELYQIQHKEKN